MIWAFLVWYFFGGTSGLSASILTTTGLDDLSNQVEVVVAEPSRRDHALTVLNKLREEAKGFEKIFVKSGKQLNSLYRNHSSGRDEALFVLDKLDADWEERQDHALNMWLDLRTILTEDEWSTLFGMDEEQ